MKSTDKTAVQELSKGVYRLTAAGNRSALTGRFTSSKRASQVQVSSVPSRTTPREASPKK